MFLVINFRTRHAGPSVFFFAFEPVLAHFRYDTVSDALHNDFLVAIRKGNIINHGSQRINEKFFSTEGTIMRQFFL